jgi:tripartite-type tricarboxylate transporter receptor subunit TctC
VQKIILVFKANSEPELTTNFQNPSIGSRIETLARNLAVTQSQFFCEIGHVWIGALSAWRVLQRARKPSTAPSERRAVLTGGGARALLLTVLMLFASAYAGAQSPPAFPNRAVKIVVPFGAGGVADLTARTVAQRLTETLGQSVVVENRPGAGGVVAATTVARAEPDGHTLLLISNGTAVSAGLFKTLPFDPVKDFAPISLFATFDIAIVTAAESKFQNLADLLAWARANPGKLNIGSINIGSTQHLAAELFKTTAGLQAEVIPFNGTPAVITALRGGQIDVAVEILGPVLPQIRSQALRALAVTSERRTASLPEVPTAAEAGLKGLLASSWNGLAAPAKTPPEVIERLNREVVQALNYPAVRQKLQDLNVEPKPGTAAAAGQWLQSEIKIWTAVIDRAGIAKQ